MTKDNDKDIKVAFSHISPSQKIPNLEELLEEVEYKNCYPIFSFKYYDHKHKKFSASKMTNYKDFHLLLKHLHLLSHLTWREIELSESYNAHDVTWSETSQQTGFPMRLGDTPRGFPPYQFKAFGKCRVFGFHARTVFYIVWLDSKHEIYRQ